MKYPTYYLRKTKKPLRLTNALGDINSKNEEAITIDKVRKNGETTSLCAAITMACFFKLSLESSLFTSHLFYHFSLLQLRFRLLTITDSSLTFGAEIIARIIESLS